MGGLYRIIANNKNGFIVESLTDSKRTMISATQRIMTLSDIAVYTSDGELPLKDVFRKIQETGDGKLEADPKGDQEKLRTYFKKIVPNFDEEKVYSSDIKKMLTWYEALRDKIDFKKVEEEDDDEGTKLPGSGETEKPIKKVHEMHGPKTENAKTTTARTRKKV